MTDEKESIIEGTWLTAKEDAHIEISKVGDTYQGKIVWLERTHEDDGSIRKDHLNPKKELQNHEIMGMAILNDFKYKGKGNWEGGTVYDPDSGKTYSGNISLNGHDMLKLRGFVGISLLGRTEYWNRVDEE